MVPSKRSEFDESTGATNGGLGQHVHNLNNHELTIFGKVTTAMYVHVDI